ncbi:cytochrome c oxidase assembly protein [Nocardioides sp. AE5]|uniref:cytochrome c oxidase assembly protein n=1 Tax=Nocardioides sp. AE5 TaxID=2962573 RepID=UPI0028818C6C|nr:cytochrome c oxidase assembly protein [Nocardioides sp. AE5]MDT0201183.1 cytochrome c oxidase assembly protein [Nocardioides sp. AE5]
MLNFASIVPLVSELDLPRFTFSRVFTEWAIDPFLFVATVWVTGAYLIGVEVLRRRGDRWPIGRTIAFVGLGMGGFFLATTSGVSVYDTTLVSVHMVQHMILSMWVPMWLALGAPVTLALRTLPATPRRWLLAVLHSRVVKVLSFPPLTLVLYIVSPWALYFSGWYDASLASTYVHEMMHVHLVLVGALFFWPLMGVDPIPGRVAYPFRLLLIFITLPFHAFLGVTIMGQGTVIGEEHYTMLRESTPMAAWLPDMLADQKVAGGILWSSGEFVGLFFFGALFVQWMRQSVKEAEREDRRLDREDARAAAAARKQDG